jgi:hypothetical protein
MFRRISTALLAAIVFTAMLGAQCVICPPAQDHGCCKPPSEKGGCHKPVKHTDCDNMAFEPQGYHKAPISVAAVVAEPAVVVAPELAATPRVECAPAPIHPTLDLFLLNSSLLV